MNSRANQSGYRFADYFVICGLDLNSGLEPDRLNADNLQSTPLDRSYKCKVLGHYPENVPWNPLDKSAVCMLCLPNGLHFRTQKHSLEPSFHSFVITREDGSRSYGFSHIFYEEVANKKIRSAMQTLQAMHITELSSYQRRAGGNHSWHGEGLVDDTHNTRSLPRHFKLAAHHQGAAQSYYDVTKDTLYVSKSIALISQLPYVFAARKFLEGLLKCSSSSPDSRLSLESYVYNLLYEVPIPQPGRSVQFSYFCGGAEIYENVVIQRPSSIEELPVFDFPLREMFCLLGIECVIQLFTCVLLEHQVLLCSSDFQRLMVVAESITCLLFPFTWQHVYVPILPASLQHFLDAPVPFVMGLHSCESHLKIASEGDLCYVDIDNRRIQLPEELPLFPQQQNLALELQELFKKTNIPLGECDSLMTRSCNISSSSQFHRKHSWSHDSDSIPDISGLISSSCSVSRSSRADTLQKIVTIVQQSGVILDDVGNFNSSAVHEKKKTDNEQYIDDLHFNTAVREIFLNRFVNIFSSYEHFIILPNQNREQWLSNRDTMQNFDKATFLSDQPDKHLPFLSRFIESQMFATLIDNKIMTMWSDVDPNLRVFDRRIYLYRKKSSESLGRPTDYESCITIRDSQLLLEKRLANVDHIVPFPREIHHQRQSSTDGPSYKGCFPLLDATALKEHQRYRKKCNNQQYWRENQYSGGTYSSKFSENSEMPQDGCSSFTADSSGIVNSSHPSIRPKLSIDDCKSRTKRMLVEKMGTEAVELGHEVEVSISGVEENTLIAGLCDLLEKIWSHGLQQKQGKSALWSHLTNYQELVECNDTSKPIDPNFLTPDLSSMTLEPDITPSSAGQESKKMLETKSPKERRAVGISEPPVLHPLPVSLTFDMRNVQAMSDIKTHIGYARAWVRLSLEKKLLSCHLRTLLSDTVLLRNLYKRSAFLRCEDEREQFLCHLLTLNAVDYFCFTNTYPTMKLPYRVIIFPSRKANAATTSANISIAVSGTLGESSTVPIPRGSLDFIFHNKNLGILTTLCIGHDNSGPSPKWLVEHVIVRNEVSGHTYKFPCGRWLGRGIDDGSTERLLVGELVPHHVDNEELIESCRTSPRCRSPNVQRRSSENKPSMLDIQHMLGDAVNRIVKFYYKRKHEKDRSTLTLLLCGEMGLVYCLEQVFLCGFKSSRLFGRNLYLWDFLVRVKEQLEECHIDFINTRPRNTSSTDYYDNSKIDRDELEVMQSFCNLVDHINTNHLLNRIIPCIASAKLTIEMYEEQSFLRDASSVTFLKQLLSNLNEFDIELEHSITKSIGT
ncbi:DENN domain-containing protein 5B [Gryllus bimaculatus]|nr:DENN domain-containing protein 5B [Gryllus bimaculatus]